MEHAHQPTGSFDLVASPRLALPKGSLHRAASSRRYICRATPPHDQRCRAASVDGHCGSHGSKGRRSRGFTNWRQRAPPPPTQRRHSVQICGSLTWTGPYPGALLGERWPSMSVCQILRKPGDISLLSGPVRIGHWRQTDSRIEGTTTLGVPPPSSEHLNQGAQPAGTPTSTTRPARSRA